MSADSKSRFQSKTSRDRQFENLLSRAAQKLQRQAATDKRAKGNNSGAFKHGAKTDLGFAASGAAGQW